MQRQCDGLQSTIDGMGLEIKGNSHGTLALKNRARLLRKERQKQVKCKALSGQPYLVSNILWTHSLQ